MQIKRSGTRPFTKGSDEFFTGNVRVEPLFQASEPGRVLGGLVTFEPGARSAWHTHPLGQSLIVTEGRGWIQCWGSRKKEIGAGDVISCPCGQRHWHGATATTGMTHIAIQEALNGKVVEWLEKVTDEEYLAEVEPD
jgi:quercetin dioxygenase-like cupin family protein